MLLVHIMNYNTNIFLRFIYREQAGIEIIIQQNLCKVDTIGAKKKCPLYRAVRFIEIFLR